MNTNRYKSLGVLMIALVLAVPGRGSAQGTFDKDRMERDIDIMEAVLERLISPGRSGVYSLIWTRGSVKGVYLDDFGVVFRVVDQQQTVLAPHEADLLREIGLEEMKAKVQYMDFMLQMSEGRADLADRAQIDTGEVVILRKRLREKEAEEKRRAQAALRMRKKQDAETRDRIISFLGEYADAMGQLRPDDWIAVMVDYGRRSGGFLTAVSEGESESELLVVRARKKTVSDYRRGRIGEKAFRNGLFVDTGQTKSEMADDLKIMSTIIEAAFEREEPEGYAPLEKIRGFYLDGLGVMMFMRASPRRMEAFLGGFTVQAGEGGITVAGPELKAVDAKRSEVAKSRSAKRGRRNNSGVEALKKKLGNLLGRYGNTIRGLKAEEWVIMNVTFEGRLSDDIPTTMIMRVRKGDIDKLQQKRLTQKAFTSRIRYTTY